MVPGNERKYGLECVGVVTNVGKAVTSFSVGDKVATVMKDGGGFSNKLITPSHLSQKIPEGISFEVCALALEYGQWVINHHTGGYNHTNLLRNSSICPKRFGICTGWTSESQFLFLV